MINHKSRRKDNHNNEVYIVMDPNGNILASFNNSNDFWDLYDSIVHPVTLMRKTRGNLFAILANRPLTPIGVPLGVPKPHACIKACAQ